jgi:hypothetical protein
MGGGGGIPRISLSVSSGVISLMSWRNWCMRLTSCKNRSAIAVVLFMTRLLCRELSCLLYYFLASYIIDERANFLGRQKHVAFLGGIDHSATLDLPIDP